MFIECVGVCMTTMVMHDVVLGRAAVGSVDARKRAVRRAGEGDRNEREAGRIQGLGGRAGESRGGTGGTAPRRGGKPE